MYCVLNRFAQAATTRTPSCSTRKRSKCWPRSRDIRRRSRRSSTTRRKWGVQRHLGPGPDMQSVPFQVRRLPDGEQRRDHQDLECGPAELSVHDRGPRSGGHRSEFARHGRLRAQCFPGRGVVQTLDPFNSVWNVESPRNGPFPTSELVARCLEWRLRMKRECLKVTFFLVSY